MTKKFYKECVKNLVADENFQSKFKSVRMAAVIGTLTACLFSALKLTDEEDEDIKAIIDDYIAGAEKN